MDTTKLQDHFLKDIENIQSISMIPNMLDVICRTTGMGFAAVARVTEQRWITCSVRDDIGFGLKPGDELELKTTICDEIRASGKAVIIDQVSCDPHFKNHHTPAIYGFESYISIPIFRKDGSFFGTLCAIDPQPHEVTNPAITNMFYLFADLISFHLDAIDKLDANQSELVESKLSNELLEQKIRERTREIEENYASLEKMNKELESFAYISSHDLQEPLRKIQTFASIIEEKEIDNLSDSGKDYFKRMQQAAERMQILINDLLTYSRASIDEKQFELLNLDSIITNVKEDLKEELQLRNATITLDGAGQVHVIGYQFRQLLYNLLSNSLKFADPDREPHISIVHQTVDGNCHISIRDNGIGFDQQYSERIFELFHRLHDKSRYQGTGIGLAIVKKIVDNHNGSITAKSSLNEGATFDIYLPNKILQKDIASVF